MDKPQPTPPDRHLLNLVKLRLPYEKGDEPLTDQEISSLFHQGIIRATHYLFLAERYMMDLSELERTRDMDEQVEALSGVSAFMERRLSKLLKA